MNILKPNNGQEVQYIVSSNIYVRVWDYGRKTLLVNLRIPYSKTSFEGIGKSTWTWFNLAEGVCTDLSESSYSSFDDAINKAVNNPYCTVYSFDSYDEMARHWDDIKYVDTIMTTYKSEQQDE